MDLRSRLRKVASLVVELPPDEEGEGSAATSPDATSSAPSGVGAAPGRAPAGAMDDIDRRLAAMRTNINTLGSGGGSAAVTKTVEQIARDTSGPNLDAVSVPAPNAAPPDAPPVLMSDGALDFGALYRQANLPAAPFTAEQMLEMLTSLPADLPLETKRQTVKVTLGAMGKAIGATSETIIADASRKLAALAAYAEANAKQTADFVAAGEFEIAALEAQIAEKRKGLQDAQETLTQVQARCSAEADRLDDVLEFFSLDVPPSRYAPSSGAGTPPPLPPNAA
jgi:uncharacterized coiled-coil protein SlyX